MSTDLTGVYAWSGTDWGPLTAPPILSAMGLYLKFEPVDLAAGTFKGRWFHPSLPARSHQITRTRLCLKPGSFPPPLFHHEQDRPCPNRGALSSSSVMDARGSPVVPLSYALPFWRIAACARSDCVVVDERGTLNAAR
jgi:hypothetical protein